MAALGLAELGVVLSRDGGDGGLVRLQGLVKVGREAEAHHAHFSVVRALLWGVGGGVDQLLIGDARVERVQCDPVGVAEFDDHDSPHRDDAREEQPVHHVADAAVVGAVVGPRPWCGP